LIGGRWNANVLAEMGRSIPTRSGQVLRPTNEKKTTGVLFMLSIRAATVNDVALLKALNSNWRSTTGRDKVVITEADLVRDGFGRSRIPRLPDRGMGRANGGYACFLVLIPLEGVPDCSWKILFVRQTFAQGNRPGVAFKRAGLRKRENVTAYDGKCWMESTCDRLLQEAGRYIPRSVEIVLADGEPLERAARSEPKLPIPTGS